ncbi:hypothetical protein [Acinetobacter pseudolwoffii]|uniref:hypothetical protein n=1 Tax=Acinetobacter pseudolwoffii TaxID=2053287 RepID=UPI003989F6F6
MNLTSNRGEIFSIATLLYSRLRKVSSRVIDVTYMMQDHSYAHHVITIALETRDEQLAQYVERLRVAMDLPDEKMLQTEIERDTEKMSTATRHEEGHVSFSLF